MCVPFNTAILSSLSVSWSSDKLKAISLQVAVRHAEDFTRSLGHRRCNMRFVEGQIEYLDEAGIPDESVDLIISNCVVNLSPDKERVLREAYRVLAPGGELYFSDVYCDRRLPREVQADEVSASV